VVPASAPVSASRRRVRRPARWHVNGVGATLPSLPHRGKVPCPKGVSQRRRWILALAYHFSRYLIPAVLLSSGFQEPKHEAHLRSEPRAGGKPRRGAAPGGGVGGNNHT